ncbi:MAG: Rieske (2Fe-2S) protein [Kiloniellales bacterium]|nr:Rieske (2Fe-2S) protein [Kiloniellales bacterium]
MQMGLWTKAIATEELRQKTQAAVKLGERQLAVFLTRDGIFACSDPCPHEGYPLSEGRVDPDGVLTCSRHNCKYDLFTGTNVMGGDALRVYPVEERDGQVYVDLMDPPVEHQRQTVLFHLCNAFDEHDFPRMARELARLSLLEGDPLEAIRAAIGWSCDRLEFGMGQAYAGAADWLALYEERPGDREDRLICLLEAMGHIAHDVRREKIYPYSALEEPYDQAIFLQAMEAEDEAVATANLRGGLGEGRGFAEFEAALTQAALAHYNGSGHPLIYVRKTGELIAHLGPEVETRLMLPLVRTIIFARREDRVTRFGGYPAALQSWAEGFKPSFGRFKPPKITDYRGLDVDKALALTLDYKKAAPEKLYLSLLGAMAFNMLCFDTDYQDHVDGDFGSNVGWLDFTHGIAFAAALRGQCQKFAESWPPGLLQLSCFLGRNAGYLDHKVKLKDWLVDDVEHFFQQALDSLFDHDQPEYVVSVHLLKTVLAARDEARWALENDGEATAALLAAAVNRFLSTPIKRKHLRRTARQALGFVAKENG